MITNLLASVELVIFPSALPARTSWKSLAGDSTDLSVDFGKNSLALIKETLVEEKDKKIKKNSFDEDLRLLVETRIKMTRQKINNQNLQKLLKKRIEVTRSILDLNNTTQ